MLHGGPAARYGPVVAAGTYPEEYAGVLETVDEEQGDAASLIDYERQMFEADHCEIGRWLAEDWGVPADLQEDGRGAPRTAPEWDGWTSDGGHLSCRLADMLGFQAAGPARSIAWTI